MMRKLSIFAVAVVMAAAVLLAGCGSEEAREAAPSGQGGQDGTRAFTVEELALYDGQDGQPAYVAVDGVVYDVTGSRMWPQGSHTSCPDSMAGSDLSEVMNDAPGNMRTLLMRFPVVGTLQ